MSPTRPRRRAAEVAVSLVCGLTVLTACTSSKPAATGSTSLPSAASTTASSSDTSAALPTSSDSTSSAAPTTSPTTSIATPSPGVPKDACTTAQLTVRVLRGSGAQQQEFALITFTNSGTSRCSLLGFPGVSLRRAGVLLGAPAERTPDQAHAVELAPGEQAESQVTDFSSCNAPLSDTMRVYPPNLTSFVDKPLELRGCRIVVAPVTHS